MESMRDIMQKYGCDKVEHLYYKEYEKSFESIRNSFINILEIGIWKGTSHSSWIDYFPNAQVYGIDIFTRVNPEDVPILQHPRMHWLRGDSTDPSVQTSIQNEWGDIKFDIIIDDGLHTPKANRLTFENLKMFGTGGDTIYYVEDVWPLHKMNAKELNHSWVLKKPLEYNENEWDKFWDVITSNSFLVADIDLRTESKMPDSYLIKMEI